MSVQRLAEFMSPKSVAVIGASNQPHRPGFVVMRNLLAGGFAGPIMPVTPNYQAVCGVLAYSEVADLPQSPDLAVICTRGERVPALLAELGEIGCRNVLILAAGMKQSWFSQGVTLEQQVLSVARHYQIRLLGPNCLGLQRPNLGLNASFAHSQALPGKLAFVSQSAAVCSTILDWAHAKNIGFSHFISLGDAADIDFAELLDYLGQDPNTQAILLYIDTIAKRRHFMSAARAAATTKPIIVLKTGRTQSGAAAAELHTGGLAGSDRVYDAAISRAGMLRVNDLHELFAAVQTLAHAPKLSGERLTILTNGGGPGVMAVDTLVQKGGRLTELSSDTKSKLQALLPAAASLNNPVDIMGDAAPRRYSQALKVLMDAPEVHTVLILHSPTAMAPGRLYADELIKTIKTYPLMARPTILTNWMGEDAAVAPRKRFGIAGIPTYRTPEGAATAFMHLVQYRRNQKQLLEVPESTNDSLGFAPERAKQFIAEQLHAQPTATLSTVDIAALLNCYHIASIDSQVGKTPSQAATIAKQIGFPVALKILSPDIQQKSDVGGVALHLADEVQVEQTAQAMLNRIGSAYPDAHVTGFTIQQMAKRAGAQELRIVVTNDPIFGPVIALGESGHESLDRSTVMSLPPLNVALARYQVIQALAKGVVRDRAMPERLDRFEIARLLSKVSQMVVDNPQIRYLELNPVLASGCELTVLDSQLQLDAALNDSLQRLAIRPYPKELEEWFTLKDGRTVLLRPIRPEDEPNHQRFDQSLNSEDRYKRFFGQAPKFSAEQMARFTHIDYDREMAFIAHFEDDAGNSETLGVGRVTMDPDQQEAEFSIVIASNLKGQGLGKKLLAKLIQYAQGRDVKAITGLTLPGNSDMIGLAKHLGFVTRTDFDEGIVHMVKVFA